MLKISDAVRAIVAQNPLLRFGFHHQLLNLSQVSRFIKPLVEVRTRKRVQSSAILMNLSRIQNRITARDEDVAELVLNKIQIQSGLCSFTLLKTKEVNERLNRVFNQIQERDGFITINEGISEITVILEMDNLAMAKKTLAVEPRYLYSNLGSVGVKFSEEYLTIKGVLYQLLQQVSLQGVNVVEVASTATEFNIYVDEKDVRLAFESIYHRFSKKGLLF